MKVPRNFIATLPSLTGKYALGKFLFPDLKAPANTVTATVVYVLF